MFKKKIAYNRNNEIKYTPVVPKDLCYGCGVCASICPQNAITLKKIRNDVFYAVIDKEKCNGCGICKRICPVNEWRNIYYLKNDSKKEIDLCLRPYVELGFGYSIDLLIRKNGASGGMITAILSYLLEKKEIDGVILAGSKGILDGKYEIITHKKDLMKAQKSKYFCIPLDIPLKEIKKYKKLVLVGLPCHIEAMNNATKIYPDLKKRIKYKISLFCTSNLSKDFYSYLFQKHRLKDIQEMKFRPGSWWDYNYFKVSTKNKTKTFSFRKGIISALVPSRLFSKEACLLCPDFTGHSADISFGDAWHPKFNRNKEGYNFYIIRNEKGGKLIKELKQKKIIKCQKSNIDEFNDSYLINPLIFKHEGVKERASFLRLIGKKTPENIPTNAGMRDKLRPVVLYGGRKILYFLYNHNILKYIPTQSIMVYGKAIYLLSRKRKLKFIFNYISRK